MLCFVRNSVLRTPIWGLFSLRHPAKRGHVCENRDNGGKKGFFGVKSDDCPLVRHLLSRGLKFLPGLVVVLVQCAVMAVR